MKSITPKNLAKVLALILVLWLGWQWSTHYVNWSPYRLSEYIVKNNLRAEECNNLVVFNPPGPLPDEQIRTCIYLVAELTKDPSICELLMPSSYGLSCVGGAEESLPCDVESIPYSVYWRDGNIEHTEHLRSCMNSHIGRSTLGNACCEVAKVAFLKDHNDCTPLKENQPVYDHCLYSLAWKLHDPSYCSDISKDNPRTACEVQTKALQQDPSICSGCTVPVENIEELR